jgi:hypothetical protein
LAPPAVCKTSASRSNSIFALGAYRLVPEAANTARWNGEIPLDNKDEYRGPAVPVEFWKACLATGRPLWNAANIYAPTLVIAGQYDTWSYPEDREGLMRDLVHAPVKRSALIPDATHFVPFEKNRFRFFDAILKFLKEQRREKKRLAITGALSSCWTRFSPLIMHVGVHCGGIVIVTPPSDIAISHVPGADEPGNGTAAIGIIEAVVARFFSGCQQSLAMLPDMILDLSAGHGEGIGGGCG